MLEAFVANKWKLQQHSLQTTQTWNTNCETEYAIETIYPKGLKSLN